MNNAESMRCRVRPMTPEDLVQVLEWRNHPEIRRHMFTQHEISLDEHLRWFERCSRDNRRHLLIFECERAAAGVASFSELNSGRVAEWGFYAAPEAPQGTGRQLGTTALDHAFNCLQLHKICGKALGGNERSIHFHLALGFLQEGILRDQYCDGERYHDVVCFGLLLKDWTSHR